VLAKSGDEFIIISRVCFINCGGMGPVPSINGLAVDLLCCLQSEMW
jgi:hypothetical protein